MPCYALVLAATLLVPGAAPALQESSSAAASAALATLLDAHSLSQFAVKAEGTDDRYLSVMYVPRVQLLVVSARHPVPAALDARIAAKDFAGAYSDHNGSNLTDGKLFVMDLGADGIVPMPKRGAPFDIAYENGKVTTRFDGDWKGQQLQEPEYRRRAQDIERRYAEILTALIAGVSRLSPQ